VWTPALNDNKTKTTMMNDDDDGGNGKGDDGGNNDGDDEGNDINGDNDATTMGMTVTTMVTTTRRQLQS
jgi:hypothetical protein